MPKQRRIERKAARAAAKAASVLSKVPHPQIAAKKGTLVWSTPLKEQQQSPLLSKLLPGKQQRKNSLKRPA